MAMTAWSAKVLSSSICLSVKGRTSRAPTTIDADRHALAQQRHAEDASGSAGSSLRRDVTGTRIGD